MKDILNLKIKRRESFRPFAPSILREHVAEWWSGGDADTRFAHYSPSWLWEPRRTSCSTWLSGLR